MIVTNILGIDISKATIDCHLYQQKEDLEAVPNNSKGFKSLIKWLKTYHKGNYEGLLVVMEYTGIYTFNLEKFLHQNGIAYVKRPALDIKRSLGMVRGKTDKADARFISKYGWMRKDELKPMEPVKANILQLQQLMNYRDKLVVDKASYASRNKELKEQMGIALHKGISRSSDIVMKALTAEIKKTEATMKELLTVHEELGRTYELVSSVVGIGFATAVHFIVATENFTRFSDARKLVCYCGVAPFRHQSGTSIRGRTKVSHLANKKLKTLLTLGAIAAVRFDPALKDKYEQKVKQGKAKMSVLNVIRAKLIYRMFAVVKRQSKYNEAIAA